MKSRSRKPSIVAKRAGLLVPIASNLISRALLERKKPLLQRQPLLKTSRKSGKKGSPSIKQATPKFIAPAVQSVDMKKQHPAKVTIAPRQSLHSVQIVARDFTRIAEKSSAPAPTPISVLSIPVISLQKVVTPPQTATHSHQIREPKLSPAFIKKIAQFNREPDIYTYKAYNAIMSGVKAA